MNCRAGYYQVWGRSMNYILKFYSYLILDYILLYSSIYIVLLLPHSWSYPALQFNIVLLLPHTWLYSALQFNIYSSTPTSSLIISCSSTPLSRSPFSCSLTWTLYNFLGMYLEQSIQNLYSTWYNILDQIKEQENVGGLSKKGVQLQVDFLKCFFLSFISLNLVQLIILMTKNVSFTLRKIRTNGNLNPGGI